MSLPPLVVCLGIALGVVAAPGTPHQNPALVDSAAVWQRTGEAARVDSTLGPAIAAARADHDGSALRRLLLARGRARAAFGMASRAEPDLREAVALATAATDTASRLDGLRWLGVCESQLGRNAEAAQTYRELALLATAAADSQHLGWAWLGLAFDHYQAGRSEWAAALYHRAARVLARGGELRGATWAWNGYGLALRQQGEYPSAAAAFQQALASARTEGDAFNEAAALNYLGRLELQIGDPGRAAGMLEQALRIHRRFGHHREGALAAIDVATAAALQGRLESAAAGLDSARAACKSAGLLDLELLATGELADVRLAQRRPRAAARLCRRALAHSKLPSTMLAIELRLSLAHALVAMDSLDAALSVLDEADRYGPGATSLRLRVAVDRGRLLTNLGQASAALQQLRPAVASARRVGARELQVALLTITARAQLASAAPDSALSSFLQAADAWEASRSLPVDPDWRELRGAAAAELFSYGCATLLDHPMTRDPAQRTIDAFAFAQRYKARTLQERLRGPGQRLAPAPTPADSPHRCATALRAGDVLLDFVQGEDLAVVFCVTPETTLAAVLPGARAIGPQVRHLEAILNSDLFDAADLARGPAWRIAAALPAAVRSELAKARRVYFSPDGTLHRLPLALLCGSDPEALLMRDCEIARLPAVALLRDPAPAAPLAHGGGRVLAIAGRDSAGGLPLPGAAAETRWLAAFVRRVERIEAPGSGSLDSAAWRRADVVHLATHVRVDVQQPWNTALAWSPGTDGELRARDVGRLQLRADLAVLSGCRTAGTRVLGGEGLSGLAAGFLVAGTSTVVATLWPIDDAAAAQFTRRFYRALAEGLPVGTALARTREELRDAPETRSPRHWAGFVLTGDPELRVPLRLRPRSWPLAVLLTALAVATAGHAARRSARRAPIP